MDILRRVIAHKLPISFGIFVLALVPALFSMTAPRFMKAAAMLVSFCADMMLARYPPFTRIAGGYSLEKGAGMFMLAHVFYIIAFTLLIRQSGTSFLNLGFWIGCTMLLAAVIAVAFLHFRGSVHRAGRLFLSLGYSLVIGTMGIAACSYAFAAKGFAFAAAIGALSFMISDMVIGVSAVGGLNVPRSEELIWTFYPIGQILLILS